MVDRNGRMDGRGWLRRLAGGWHWLLFGLVLVVCQGRAASPVGGLLTLPEEPADGTGGTGVTVSLGGGADFNPMETWSPGRPTVVVEDASFAALEHELQTSDLGTGWGSPWVAGVIVGAAVLGLGALAFGAGQTRRGFR